MHIFCMLGNPVLCFFLYAWKAYTFTLSSDKIQSGLFVNFCSRGRFAYKCGRNDDVLICAFVGTIYIDTFLAFGY